MKAMIIGAGSEALHTIKKAHEQGLLITALDGNPDAEGLRAADTGLVVDISKERSVIETAQRERPDFILTAPIGRYLTTVGAVNDALHLPGISRQMAVLCTDKYRFHQKLQEQSLRQSHCYAVGGEGGMHPEELRGGIIQGDLPLTFPAILKPRFGSGSRGIHMIQNKEALDLALENEEYVLEECVPGEEYGVDGAVICGRFYLGFLRRKENTPPPARQAVGYFSVLPGGGFWRQVQDYMERIVSCLGLSECLLHADIIESPDGPFIVEMSARPSGHNLHNLFTPLCTGIDMAEEYIRYRMGMSWSFTPAATRRAVIHYFDMQGEVLEVPCAQQAQRAEASLLDWKCNISQGQVLAPVSDGHSLMGRGYFILEGGEDDLPEKIGRIKALFRIR